MQRNIWKTLGFYSLSGRTSYQKISRILEAANFMFRRFSIVLEFDKHLGSSAAETPVEFLGDTTIIIPNLAASRLHEILR